jgi:hypothetical protein
VRGITDLCDRSTNVKEANLLFCIHRPEKGPLAKQNGITIFIDDTPENLVSCSLRKN